MPKADPRVDAYVAASADFAKPILKRLREAVHAACPGVEEAIKWRMPAFTYQGMLCVMAAFKHHCSFHCRQHDLILSQYLATEVKTKEGIGRLRRLVSLTDLPPDQILIDYIKHGARLGEE